MASKRAAMQQRLKDKLEKQKKAKEEAAKNDAANTAAASANSKANTKGKGKEKPEDNNTPFASHPSAAVTDSVFEKRMIIAQATIKAVGEMVPLGPFNRDIPAFIIVNGFLTGNSQLAWYSFLRADIEAGKQRTPKEVKDGIITSINQLISRGESIKLHVLGADKPKAMGENIRPHLIEPKKLKAIIAFTLWSMFFQKKLEKVIWPSDIPNELEFFCHRMQEIPFIRLFKTINCGMAKNLVLDYLLKEKGAAGIFPLHIISIEKPGISSHSAVLMGEFPTNRKKYSLVELLADENLKDSIVFDAWIEKAFRLQNWNSEAPDEYRDKGNDIRFSCDYSFTPASVAFYKQAVASPSKSLGFDDLGITASEVDKWVEELFNICSGKFQQAPEPILKYKELKEKNPPQTNPGATAKQTKNDDTNTAAASAAVAAPAKAVNTAGPKF